jgi:hypothetical protein
VDDPGISGGKEFATRPARTRLLDVARKSKLIIVVASHRNALQAVPVSDTLIKT